MFDDIPFVPPITIGKECIPDDAISFTIFNKEIKISQALKTVIETAGFIYQINEENVDEIYDKIQEDDQNLFYYIKCIMYAISIRPKQTENLIKLLRKATGECNYSSDYVITDYCLSVLAKEGFISEDNSNENSENKDLEEIIKRDDIEKFITIAGYPDFNPQEKISIPFDSPIHFLINNDFGFRSDKRVTYMQMMAYYGSIKCFKYALMDESFNTYNIEKFAIAGGNVEIIRLLEQKNVSFNYYFSSAIDFRHDKIATWLVENYKIEEEVSMNSLKFFDDKGLIFLFDKVTKNQWEHFFPIICENGDAELFKYLTEYKNIFPAIKTLVVNACSSGSLEIVKYLINNEISTGREKIKEKTALHAACKSGNYELVKYLVEECSVSVKLKDELGRTPLHVAIQNGNLEFVKYLIENCSANAGTLDSQKKTALLTACEYGKLDIVKYLIEELKVPRNDKTISGETALHLACKTKNLDLIKYLIEDCKLKVNARSYGDIGNVRPLWFASRVGNLRIIKYLVEECNTSAVGISNDAVTLAIKSKNYELAKYFVNVCDANVNNIQDDLLIRACIFEDFEQIRFLIDTCRFDVNGAYEYSGKIETPIVAALRKEKYNVAEFLIKEYNAETTELYECLFEYACREQKLGIIEFLVKHYEKGLYVPIESERNALPFEIVIKSNGQKILKMLAEEFNIKIDINDINKKYIFSALLYGRFNNVRALIEYFHADANSVDERGRSILYHAVHRSNTELIKFLVEKCHVKIESKDELNDYLLYSAKDDKFDITVYLIMKFSAGKTMKDDCGKSLFEIAIEKCNLKFIFFLLDHCHISIEINDSFYKHLFDLVNNNRFDIATVLIRHFNPDLTRRDERGNSLFYYAVKKCNLDFINFLIDECHIKVSINGRDNFIFIMALRTCPIDIVKRLVETFKPKIRGDIRDTLINAIDGEDPSVVEYIIEKLGIKIKINGRDKIYLFHAVENGNINIVKYFFSRYHVDTHLRDDMHRPLLYVAALGDSFPLVKYLVEEESLDTESGIPPLSLIHNHKIRKYLTNYDSDNTLQDCFI